MPSTDPMNASPGDAELASTLADVLHGTATEVLDVLHVTSGSVGSYHYPDRRWSRWVAAGRSRPSPR